jgi:hypothetical protein
MGHTPYGYRIENGQAVIDEAAASVIRMLYKNYLSGMGLMETAKEAGLTTYHGTVKRMLQNKHYLGDEFYPAIIDKATFDAVPAELNKRAGRLGRLNRAKAIVIKPIPTTFNLKQPEKELPNPFRQAEYLYSLIETEVSTNGSK